MEKNLQTSNRQEIIAVWSERIAACRSSGISVRAWCEGNGISTASYNKWQKKLFCLAAQTAPKFDEVCVALRPRFPLPCIWKVFQQMFIRVRTLKQRPWCCRFYSHAE